MGFHISGFNILIGNEAGDGGQLKDMMQSDVNETIKFLNEIHELTKEFSANDTLDRWIFVSIIKTHLDLDLNYQRERLVFFSFRSRSKQCVEASNRKILRR